MQWKWFTLGYIGYIGYLIMFVIFMYKNKCKCKYDSGEPTPLELRVMQRNINRVQHV